MDGKEVTARPSRGLDGIHNGVIKINVRFKSIAIIFCRKSRKTGKLHKKTKILSVFYNKELQKKRANGFEPSTSSLGS
jgi:hypothetical protein